MKKLNIKENKFFEEPTDSVIISIMEGLKGNVWIDDENKQAFAFDGIYGYLDGEVTEAFVLEVIEMAMKSKKMENITLVPQGEIAEAVLMRVLEKCKQVKYEKKLRYLMSEPAEGFDITYLQGYLGLLPQNMKIESFTEEYFNMMKKSKELEYLTESYRDYEEFENVGVGFLIIEDTMKNRSEDITKNKKIVAGAVSYSVFSEGMEIQLMTIPEYRGKGLAKIVVAKLLLHCAENKLRAIWDAANITSVSIANKMGYVLKRKYNAFTIYEK